MDNEEVEQQAASEKRSGEFGSVEERVFGGEAPLSGSDSEETPHKKAGASRLLILLLVLVGGIGVALYLFGQILTDPALPVAPVNVPTQSKMKVPARPAPVVKAGAIKEEIVPAEKVAAVETKPQPVSVVAPKAAPPVLAPVFALSAGGYLNQMTLKKTISQIGKSGYRVESSQVPEPREMLRLLVGLYGKTEALKKLKQVQKLSEGAFMVAVEGEYAVYAGSFLSIDKARRQADRIYAQGVRVDEVKARVDLPRTTLRFGGFATRAEALRVMNKLQKKGVKKLQIVSYK